MTDPDADRVWLFAYGTLRQPEVQRGVFGREVPTLEDALPGARLEPLRITDPHVVALSGSDVHRVLRRAPADACVPGVVLAVGEADLARADDYEVADYARVQVRLASGRRAFAYVHRDEAGGAWAGDEPLNAGVSPRSPGEDD